MIRIHGVRPLVSRFIVTKDNNKRNEFRTGKISKYCIKKLKEISEREKPKSVEGCCKGGRPLYVLFTGRKEVKARYKR
jgi:hypothetical protein|tara:strand:- start:1708 stop:1941 length:234 start_codon:yes stop_codon:yes gene_type:complete